MRACICGVIYRGFATVACINPFRIACDASPTAPGPEGTKMVEFPPFVPTSFIVSKYCVIIIISNTSLLVIPSTGE